MQLPPYALQIGVDAIRIAQQMELGTILPQVRQSTQPTLPSLSRSPWQSKADVPRAPVVQDTGNRNGWTDIRARLGDGGDSYQARADATSNPARTLQFPEEDMAEVTCWRSM